MAQRSAPPEGRVLSARELNRALLARQLLLERVHLPIPKALERVAGLQTQYAPAGYLALWARLEDFQRNQLTAALEDHAVVQATLMRSTIHMVSAADYWAFSAGTLPSRRAWLLRTRRNELAGADVAGASAAVRELLHLQPRRQADILKALEARGISRLEWATVSIMLELVRVPPSGTWSRRRADLYGRADEWLEVQSISEADGLELLVRRYLEGFGPAAATDIAGWAGVPVAAIGSILRRLELVRFRDERNRELIDLPGLPLPAAETPAPVRLLPVWETGLLAHGRRTDILPERYRSLVFDTKTPHSVNTLLVDGQVAGTWRFDGGHVTVAPFERLDGTLARAVKRESDRLEAFHAEAER